MAGLQKMLWLQVTVFTVQYSAVIYMDQIL